MTDTATQAEKVQIMRANLKTKAARDLVELAEATDGVSWASGAGEDSGGSPFFAVLVGQAKGAQYKLTWHTRDTGSYRLFSKIYAPAPGAAWQDAPSLKWVREQIAAVGASVVQETVQAPELSPYQAALREAQTVRSALDWSVGARLANFCSGDLQERLPGADPEKVWAGAMERGMTASGLFDLCRFMPDYARQLQG